MHVVLSVAYTEGTSAASSCVSAAGLWTAASIIVQYEGLDLHLPKRDTHQCEKKSQTLVIKSLVLGGELCFSSLIISPR